MTSEQSMFQAALATAIKKLWEAVKAFFRNVKERMSKVVAVSKQKGIVRIPYEARYERDTSWYVNRVIASGTKRQAHRTLTVRRRTS
ncbi:hypothetical protein [Exiguobacterium antarcticum]|uniref:hypothetical protein n=1 Tax=Exiguobacterium antarcticum TaxID=132920 RepID=UPI00047BCADF|nr:hypothetical protein [Exiguobacterium antarcticum]